jgi:hypothetical protein
MPKLSKILIGISGFLGLHLNPEYPEYEANKADATGSLR